jgi:hypothetical protein
VTDPVVGAVSPEDTALTSGDRGRAADLVREPSCDLVSGRRDGRWPGGGGLSCFTGFAWLIIAVIVLRFTLTSVTTDLLALLVA